MLTLLVPFRGFTGKFLYHCHLAEHADNDMMRPFKVIAATEGRSPSARIGHSAPQRARDK